MRDCAGAEFGGNVRGLYVFVLASAERFFLFRFVSRKTQEENNHIEKNGGGGWDLVEK